MRIPKHTPTPWRLSETDAAVILADDHSDESDYPYAVAFCEPCVPLNGEEDYGQFNAARIVLAVNAYDDLVAALELILPMAKGYAAAHPVGANANKIARAEDVLSAQNLSKEA